MNEENERLREQAEAQQDHEQPAAHERTVDDGLENRGPENQGPVSGGPNGGQTLGHGQDPGWRSQAPQGTSAQAPAEGARQDGKQQQQQQQGGVGDVGVNFQTDPSLERAVGLGPSGGHDGHVHMQVREHMEVVGADGVHLGTVDAVEGERIKLTRADSGSGAVQGQQGRHHYLPVGLVAAVEGNRVRLSANADVAYGMEELD